MKKFIIILAVFSITFTVLNSQVPKSELVFESFMIKSLKSGNTKVTIQYNKENLREIINYERPDSNGIFQPSVKYFYEYNDSGKVTIIQTLVFTDGEWKIYEKRIFQYDENARLIKNITLNISGNMVDMDTATVYETVYDVSGNIIEKIDKSKVFGVDVQNQTKTTFEYSSTQKMKIQHKFKWENNNWVDYSLIRKNYNENDSIVSDSSFMWKENKWNYSMLYNYGYDTELNLSLLEINLYEEGQWIKMERYHYDYDENRRRVETIKEKGINNQWAETGRTTIEFRSDGQIASEKGYMLNNNELKVVSEIQYNYNNDGKNTEIIYKILLNEVWTNSYRYIYEYSEDKNLKSFKYQMWIDNNWQNSDKYLTFSDKNYTYNSNGYEIVLNWLTSSIKDFSKIIDLCIYPNPANDFIEISLPNSNHTLKGVDGNELEKVQIFDVLGIEVSSAGGGRSEVDGGGYRIDISHLSAGVYFIKIGEKVEKFVKF